VSQASNETIVDFFQRSVMLLDNRKFADWIAAFAEDGYYEVVQRSNFERNDNLLIVGEDLKRLKARLVSGEKLDPRHSVHMLFGAQCSPEGGGNGKVSVSSNFAVWRDGVPSFAGKYRLELRCKDSEIKISRWTVVLDNKIITETIYLPI